MGKFRDHYRPERHYMRGPGPKWHAKHTTSLVQSAVAQRELGSVKPAARRQRIAAWIAPTAAAAALGFVAVMLLA